MQLILSNTFILKIFPLCKTNILSIQIIYNSTYLTYYYRNNILYFLHIYYIFYFRNIQSHFYKYILYLMHIYYNVKNGGLSKIDKFCTPLPPFAKLNPQK